MLSRELLASLIETLSRDLAKAIGEDCQSCMAEMQGRIEALSAELEAARTLEQTALEGHQELVHDLEKARKRISNLTHSLKEARQAAAEAQSAAQAHDVQRQELVGLQEEVAALQDQLEQERSIRKRLEKGAAADERRLRELEDALGAGTVATSASVPSREMERELLSLQKSLQEALDDLKTERAARQGVQEALDESDRMIAALEEALKGARKGQRDAATGTSPGDRSEQEELAAKLAAMEMQLQREQTESRRAAAAYDQAVARVFELENELHQGDARKQPPLPDDDEPQATTKAGREKPLPHQLRPAPRAGARFHPDWNLRGLPCRTADQVVQAWGSVANVQLSLEGYPSQYCAAFLVVLEQARQKGLYLLFNLKSSRHILVCVPEKVPADEAALTRQINEARKYLQVSGFELEKLGSREIPNVLGRYFVAE